MSAAARPSWTQPTVLSSLGRVLGALVLAGVLLVVAAPAGLGHTDLVSSSPADGSSVPDAPAEVALVFNQAVSAQLSAVSLATGSKSPAALEVSAGETAQTIVAAIPRDSLPAGPWVVRYRVTSADGHPIVGEVSFEVMEPLATQPPPTPTAPTASPDEDASVAALPAGGEAARPDQEPASSDGTALLTGVVLGLAFAVLLFFAGRRARRSRS